MRKRHEHCINYCWRFPVRRWKYLVFNVINTKYNPFGKRQKSQWAEKEKGLIAPPRLSWNINDYRHSRDHSYEPLSTGNIWQGSVRKWGFNSEYRWVNIMLCPALYILMWFCTYFPLNYSSLTISQKYFNLSYKR